MLIYNHKKEFIGIDSQDLTSLGFTTLEKLKAEFSDFADMFVKKPGYVHNFKHVNWIDFVTCADSAESTKVIIHANGKNFRCLLDIKTAYLCEEPNSKAFLIYLTNIRELSNNESDSISEKLFEKPLTTAEPIFTAPKVEEFKDIIPSTSTQESLDLSSTFNVTTKKTFDTPIDLDQPLELDFHNEADEESLEEALKIDLELNDDIKTTKKKTDPTKVETSTEVFDNGYTYDPQIASDELGLPVDLIEEFIEDFIAQAKEFKEGLYTALNDGDKDSLKTLSHKLKGVAANLRIEDALESLTIVNTSQDTLEISIHLDNFYKIISKLSGEKITVIQTETIQNTQELNNDSKEAKLELLTDEILEETIDVDLDLDIFSVPEDTKKEILSPKDDDTVSMRIDIPELADDDFLPDVSVSNDLETELFKESEEIDIKIEEPRSSTYNPIQAAGEIGLSQEHFQEFFKDYLEEAKEISGVITKAIEDDEYKVWQSKAMQLKGMSDNMRIHDFMNELETLIKTQDTDVAKDANLEIAQALIVISKIEG